jgi:DNA-binding CsgD family transcriptional regulator
MTQPTELGREHWLSKPEGRGRRAGRGCNSERSASAQSHATALVVGYAIGSARPHVIRAGVGSMLELLFFQHLKDAASRRAASASSCSPRRANGASTSPGPSSSSRSSSRAARGLPGGTPAARRSRRTVTSTTRPRAHRLARLPLHDRPGQGRPRDRVHGARIPGEQDEHVRLSPVERLTPRERDVLRLLMNGRARKQIAGDLSISPETVKNYLSNIYGKLEVSSSTELLALALRTPWMRALVSPKEHGSVSPKDHGS